MPVQGGLFDGGWEVGMFELVADLTGAVADTAMETWRTNLDANIKVNQGRYTSTLRVDRVSDTSAVVNDGTSVYGPWLEGQGSRNFPETRFKGYGSAREAAEKVDAMAGEVGAEVTARFVEAQNA
jgi:hypothetical protein